jgi:hypothetical protein
MAVSPLDLRPPRQRAAHSPLWHLNAVLARPIAALFGLLGVAPGQLSLQSVTLTVIGLLRAANGDWSEVVQGTLLVYAGLLLDRADDLLASRAKLVPAWSRFLGLVADRVVESTLLVAMIWLAPGVQRGWEPLGPRHFDLLVASLLATLLLGRLAAAYGDLLTLRLHLNQARRLPGPSARSTPHPVRPLLSRFVDRDTFILVWVAGVITGQIQAAAGILLVGQFVVLLEQMILFWSRRRDPEAHATHVLVNGP